MRHLLVVVLLVGFTSRANADDRELWRGALAGSITVAISGGIVWYHGLNKVDQARDELCERGGYAHEPGCAMTGSLTMAELDRINAKGDRGVVLTYIGAGTMIVGVTVAGISAYKLLTATSDREDKVVVVPTVSRDGAGAAMTVRW